MLRAIGAAGFTCVDAEVAPVQGKDRDGRVSRRKRESLFHSSLVLNSIRGKFEVFFSGGIIELARK